MLSLFGVLSYLATAASAYTALSHTGYTALNNPGRGVLGFHAVFLSGPSTQLTTSSFGWPVSENRLLQQTVFYLDTRVDGSDFSAADLLVLDNTLAAHRAAGVKSILRFAYTNQTVTNDPAHPTEPSANDIESHAAQIGPVLTKYKDVVQIVQQGYIGTWGEQWYSTNFGNGDQGPFTQANWDGRNHVAWAAFYETPSTTFTSMRTPEIKQQFTQRTAPVTSSEAFDGSEESLIGHHNDCVFGDARDLGSYREADYNGADHVYVRAEAKWTPRGGETCGTQIDPALYSCTNALKVLSEENWSYFNIWVDVMKNEWINNGCFDEIKARLGYRYELGARSGDTVAMTNHGWSQVFQQFTTAILLLPKDTAPSTTALTAYYAKLNIDLRRVGAGQTASIRLNYCLPAGVTGDFDAYLAMSDNLAPNKSAFRILVSNSETSSGAPAWAKDARVNALGAATIGGTSCLPVTARQIQINGAGEYVW